MTDRTYPYTAWTLQPSFKPVQVEITEDAGYWQRTTHDRAASGKFYALSDLFADKRAAIVAGRERLLAQQSKLDKMQAAIDKRRAVLDKAEASK